ncbi:hypothetical protein [Wocania ichthyoenteri]|uniref:hypothetical protein n=1 Tax=Wocania ichthyoenteri TaxID=1230531 RepID=UPI00053E34CB|nr:hypothetical protein [Wocania ichthyoenteri]
MINFFYQNNTLHTKLLILKTDIKTSEKVKIIEPFLNNHSRIIKWSIDIEDIDNVLKIEVNYNLEEEDLITQIKKIGFYCDTLAD